MESEIRHGSKIGRFVVVAELGSGGMGVVYAAHDRELDRQVALKVMRGATEDDEDRIRMLREGQAMARVVHPNVITVFEVGSEGATVFLAQELLDAGTLGQWLEKPHSQAEILDKFIAAGRGLAAAHAAGLVHRDFKPDNVLLGKDGRVRVADFGLARAVGYQDALVGPTNRGGGPPQHDVNVTRTPMQNQLTKTGAVMGTPMYMAPEQHKGERADARSDQFSFCIALYHALYSAWPYAGKTSIALADAVINGEMQKPPKAANVAGWLRKILLRGLATNATERYPSMDALLADLAAPPKSAGRTIAFAIGGLVIVFGAALGVFVYVGNTGEKPTPVEKPVEVKPLPVGDLTIDHPERLTNNIDKGELANAKLLYDADARNAQTKAKAAVAQAAAALTLVLAGDLRGAEAKIAEADANKGTDAQANAYADLALAAVAYARGDLKTALERSKGCSTAFGKDLMAAMCLQIEGDTYTEMNDTKSAAATYTRGLELAKDNEERTSALQLALAQLDIDKGDDDPTAVASALTRATRVQEEARERMAPSCEASAAVLAVRAQIAQSSQVEAIAALEKLHPRRLQMYRIKALAQLALGQVYGYRGEGDEEGVLGLDRIDRVMKDAEKAGYWGIVLEAKLARVLVVVTQKMEGAEAERANLVREASAKGFNRIAHLAESYNPETAEPPPQTPPTQ